MSELNHKSKERIRELGEVYTPSAVAKDMLSMIAVDMNTILFEPSCGNGNIVLEMISKLLEVYENNEASVKVDLTMHNLWAIDIDLENVLDCRQRVYTFLCCELKSEQDWAQLGKILLARKIQERIDQNDCLTALELDPKEAFKNSGKTKLGVKFWSDVGHKPMPFLNGKSFLKVS
jgi:hypothetical protein